MGGRYSLGGEVEQPAVGTVFGVVPPESGREGRIAFRRDDTLAHIGAGRIVDAAVFVSFILAVGGCGRRAAPLRHPGRRPVKKGFGQLVVPRLLLGRKNVLTYRR